MQLGIFGPKSFQDYGVFCDVMKKVLQNCEVVGPSIIVSGGDVGTDFLARRWAVENGRVILEFIPLWDKHGESAVMLRNRQIRQWSTHGLGFCDGHSEATESMIKNWPSNKPLRIFDFDGIYIR